MANWTPHAPTVRIDMTCLKCNARLQDYVNTDTSDRSILERHTKEMNERMFKHLKKGCPDEHPG